jgi:hypothetical protein
MENEIGAIRKVTVSDNGHGISVDEIEATFGRIGGSWKRLASKTKYGKRGLHGSLGQGRLRVFALGSRVEWVSHGVDTAGVLKRVEIRGGTARRHAFHWESQPVSDLPTGTVVTAWNDSQKSLAALEAETTPSLLRSHFAPVLLNDDELIITYNGMKLDPADEISATTRLHLTFADDATQHEASLLIIEWKAGTHRAIYYGPDDEHFVHEESAKELEPPFSYSAYVTWEGLSHDAVAMLPLGDMAGGAVGGLWNATRDAIHEHFHARRRERRRAQVAEWKKNKTYPYEGEPRTEAEKAERAVFDVVSGTLSQQISKN